MSNLDAFLNPSEDSSTKKITISSRFKNKDGSLATATFRSIKNSESDAILARCKIVEKKRGNTSVTYDNKRYTKLLIIASCVDPRFDDATLLAKHGVVDPCDLLDRMFNVGEYTKLAEAALTMNGHDDDIEEEVKN